ncbi:MAG: uracil-DNA glycosylase [Planctomycetes bacterium]|nr:uracil-DNA glycosylase [Planctomycetota bacterium]
MKSWGRLNEQIIQCEACPRLRSYCQEVATQKKRAYVNWEYWGRPVPNFGDPQARLLIVGLAPAAHGANRTGRMFTGDRSGEWLYRALFKAGFANQPHAEHRDDGLELIDCAITATCHCAPPDNRPLPAEIASCQAWFQQTVDLLPARVFLALGQIAWRTVVDELWRRQWLSGRLPKFGHGAVVSIADERVLIGSYHPSQQNTFTGRLTEEMLDQVFTRARESLPAKNSR